MMIGRRKLCSCWKKVNFEVEGGFCFDLQFSERGFAIAEVTDFAALFVFC